ncbi:MAG: pilus assembly protein [Deltaproteobacteria bacterium]|nr:pilus assembly protein [Deltaproteobacteria bacterium]
MFGFANIFSKLKSAFLKRLGIIFSSDSDQSPAQGATLLEVSLVCGFFMLLVFAFLDFGRYMATRAILMKAVQNTLNYAQKVSYFEAEVRGLPTSDVRYLRLVASRLAISNHAGQFPQSTFVGNILDEFRVYSLNGGSPTLVPPNGSPGYNALILRPGESGYLVNRGGRDIQHPTLCSPQGACPSGTPRLQNTDAWPQIIRDHPLYIEMSAQINPILPIWPAGLIVRSTALGFRETSKQTEIPPPRGTSNPVPTIPPPPTPPPTPLPTPTPPPGPTPTPPPGPTPVPTPSQTPWVGPTPLPTPSPTPWVGPTPDPTPTPNPTPTATPDPTPPDTPVPTPTPNCQNYQIPTYTCNALAPGLDECVSGSAYMNCCNGAPNCNVTGTTCGDGITPCSNAICSCP